jgi:putative membrane protein
MLIEIIIALLLGCIIGTFTGLIPGIHINLIGIFLISLSTSILGFVKPINLIIFISAMAITHTFVDFIPSVFLGCPDTDTELSVLPGHELLKKGQGYQAVLLTCYGSILSIFTLILISFPFILIIEKVYNFLQKPYFMATILIAVSIILITFENKKFLSLFTFLLSGFLGLCVLNLKINQPLLPLLTGLFGGSMLILSIKNKIKIPKQKISKPQGKIKNSLARAFIGSLIASPLCSFLPGLGSGQAAIIGNIFTKSSKKGFLILIGATNTLVMGFSFITLYTISKTRTGAAVAVKEIIGNPSLKILLIILSTIIISGIISFFITKFLAKIFSTKIQKLNYTKISIITLLILITITFLISGFIGVAVLTASTFTGIYIISLKVRRTQMMGCLLVPTIIIYLF